MQYHHRDGSLCVCVVLALRQRESRLSATAWHREFPQVQVQVQVPTTSRYTAHTALTTPYPFRQHPVTHKHPPSPLTKNSYYCIIPYITAAALSSSDVEPKKPPPLPLPAALPASRPTQPEQPWAAPVAANTTTAAGMPACLLAASRPKPSAATRHETTRYGDEAAQTLAGSLAQAGCEACSERARSPFCIVGGGVVLVASP